MCGGQDADRPCSAEMAGAVRSGSQGYCQTGVEAGWRGLGAQWRSAPISLSSSLSEEKKIKINALIFALGIFEGENSPFNEDLDGPNWL